jgi:hypothetical protein
VVLLAVVLVSWVLLTVPAAVLMGKCISRGLDPAGVTPSVRVPQQRGASAVEGAQSPAYAGRSQA